MSDESWSNKARTIGEIERPDHYYLGPDDQCAFFGEYTARKGWKHSTTNGIISNLKKTPDKRGTAEWQHKNRVISQVSSLICANLDPVAIPNLTIIPAPPSKAPIDPMYDDRIERIAQGIAPNIDARCLLNTSQSRPAAHLTDDRPGPDILEDGLLWNQEEANRKPIGNTVVILDDVLVTGATFVACSRIVKRAHPTASVFGLFVARRVPERTLGFDDFDIEP
ncbi:hypothetical protein FIV00_26695 [Labrenzia sp. THAF82]|uniref:phosphoribosyltransferase n=1 Tax=Labrenzia sp. THAF82 TaxID=2587861 RepID=UPI001267A209|nr:phosphoribosyltransferase [Labrenzia sp. THAF82]QFT34113.1 hypothetical protein FIV00_26695 [Labrenzia sp. THAF82]